jgi:hypothetical protein
MNDRESELENAQLGQRLAAFTGLEVSLAVLVAGSALHGSAVHPHAWKIVGA